MVESLSLRIESNLCFMPTGDSGSPHLGHLWYLLNLGYFYEKMNVITRESPYKSDLWKNLSNNLFIVIDNRSNLVPKYIEEYKYLVDWLFPGEFKLIKITDFESQISGYYFSSFFTDTDIHLNEDCVKLLFFELANIRYHLRGHDLDLVFLAQKEKAVNDFLKIRLPRYKYLALLKDENGVPISATGIKGATSNYRVDDLFHESPYKIIHALCRALKVSKKPLEIANNWIPDKSSYEGSSMIKKHQWICSLLIEFWHEFIDPYKLPEPLRFDWDGRLNIPEGWRKFID